MFSEFVILVIRKKSDNFKHQPKEPLGSSFKRALEAKFWWKPAFLQSQWALWAGVCVKSQPIKTAGDLPLLVRDRTCAAEALIHQRGMGKVKDFPSIIKTDEDVKHQLPRNCWQDKYHYQVLSTGQSITPTPLCFFRTRQETGEESQEERPILRGIRRPSPWWAIGRQCKVFLVAEIKDREDYS